MLLGLAVPAFGAEWHQEPGYRWRALQLPATGKTGFHSAGSCEYGEYFFTNQLGEFEGAANRVLQNGSGLALGDFDGDGLPDIYLCNLNGENALYHNLGNWRFTNITVEAEVGLTNKLCRGAVFADIDGDSRLDLLVATVGGGVICFQNQGSGKFANVTPAAGTASPFGAVGMALADVDGNGTLDLYVVNNRTDDIRDRGQIHLQMVRGKLTVPPNFRNRLVVIDGQVNEYGDPDILYLNDGQGHFRWVAWTDGMFLSEKGAAITNAPLDWGLTATFRDLNNDGLPDLYVCNDYWTPDRIWLNDGKGHFKAIASTALRNSSASSMGVDFADLDRDGNVDFMVVDMLSRKPELRKRQALAQRPVASTLGVIDDRPQIMRNTLQRNRGDGTFEEIANFSGLTASEWSWCPYFLDVDLDGYEDVLIAAGYFKDVQDMDSSRKIAAIRETFTGITNEAERHKEFITARINNNRLYPDLLEPILAFRNSGDFTFQEMTSNWGTEQLGIHHALAYADLDGDGDLDLVVNNLRSAATVYRNDSLAPRVAVRLKGASGNSQAIGAKVKFLNGAVPLQSQEIVSGGRYMAGCDPMLVFATGHATGGMSIEVTWRTGHISSVQNVQVNALYEIEESAFGTSPKSNESVPPFFKEVSSFLAHTHHEEAFDDFARQPFLWKKLSQMGPGIVWTDFNEDGFEDVVIGTGKGGTIAFFQNDTKGGFTNVTALYSSSPEIRDVTGLIDIGAELLFALSNYEDGSAAGASVKSFRKMDHRWSEIVPASESASGPLAAADITGRGDWRLFVGGTVIPGRYPTPASSRIFKRQSDQWILDSENSALLRDVGLVQGALFADLDADGSPELLLACEWGPIRVFHTRGGKLDEITASLGLANQTGWWSGITVGDFDEDGRLDIVAGNWGLNSPYKANRELPLQVYFGDLYGRGSIDIIETEYSSVSQGLAPRRNRETLAYAFPWLVERFPTDRSFSEASLSEILGDRASLARHLDVTSLASTLFLNRGDHFVPMHLPRQAQFAPVASVNVGDFDGDGHEDIFLSQNFFATMAELPRLDAGRGLWLRGDGKGNFTPVSGEKSGVLVYGEQRGAALGDYDRDGRIDLLVTQNGAETRLFKNLNAKPGLRVKLSGPSWNPSGIGAAIRLDYGAGKLGPVREVHAGSGYLSQDASVSVLGTATNPQSLVVRWPGGASTTVPLEAAVREVTAKSP